MTCSLIEAFTYVEEEFAVDHLSGRWVWQVTTYVRVLERHLFEVGRVELLVPGNRDGTEVSVGEQLFLAAESVAHELHGAVVVWGQVQLAFDREYDVQVLFRLDEVPEIGRNYLSRFRVRVHRHPQVGFLWLGLLLMLLWLLEHKLLPHLVEGLVVVLLVPDEVGHETRAHQA